MNRWRFKIYTVTGIIWHDLRILLDMALEATVWMVWPVVECLLRGLSQLVKLPARCLKMFF